MDGVWLGQGMTQADLEACSTALSIPGKPMPLLAIADEAGRPKLVLASRAFFGPFGVTSGVALSMRIVDGQDPGARRLAAISTSLALDASPRLERLRFFLAPGTEMITFLCRRITHGGGALFVAAAVSGIRSVTVFEPSQAETLPHSTDDLTASDTFNDLDTTHHAPSAAAGMTVQAIQSMLRTRWQASRTPRFTWQTDANMICTQVAPLLAEVVGSTNADLVGHPMDALAAKIDPTGRFGRALARKETWSGLNVSWPIADVAAAVAVGIGAIPMFNRDGSFEGYRGYGVLRLDEVVVREPTLLTPTDPINETSGGAPLGALANVVRFPNGPRFLSEEDQKTFVELGTELREEAGLNETATDRAHEVGRHALQMMDRLAVGILVSRDNVPIFANRHLLDSLGFEDEDALHDAGGMSYLFEGHPDEATRTDVVRVRGRDGRIVPNRARMQSIDWDGLPATLLTLTPALDAIPTTPDQGELGELRAILETATDGVAVIDERCNILSLNRSGEALFGCDRGTVIGKPFLSLFAPHNQQLAADYLDGLKSNATKQLLNDGREFLVNAHRGGTIPVFMTLGRLSNSSSANNNTVGLRFCALFRDLTHWKKVEGDLEAAKQEAEEANDRKSDFLTKVSHEVRTPLNAIIGFAEVMMDERFGPVGNQHYREYLKDIHTSGNHVMSLVNDLLDLSKIEAGKMELAIEIIDVNKVIGECVAIMQPQASAARVIMRLSLASTLPRIKADERSLRQILLNILSNAVKFNEPGGQVIVATAATDAGHVVIRVRDTGPGMSEADVTAALEPFRQLSTARSSMGGTGLGLPLTKALVEANEASFSIRSKVEQGTLVEVAFPPARVLTA